MKIENRNPDHSESELTWASLCHFSALMGLVWWAPIFFSHWIPVGHLIGPFVVWIIKKGSSPYVNANGKEALQFQLAITLYALILSVLPFEFLSTYSVTGLVVLSGFFAVKAGVHVSKGKHYRYPLVPWRFLQ